MTNQSITLGLAYLPVCMECLIDFNGRLTYLWLPYALGRVFPNGPGDLGSIPGHVIPKTLKWYLIPPWLKLNIIMYLSRVKWSNPRKRVVLSLTPRCSCYWKGSLLSPLTTVTNFYAWNCIHWKFIFTFLSSCFLRFFPKVTWYQIFHFNSNNFHIIIWFQISKNIPL